MKKTILALTILAALLPLAVSDACTRAVYKGPEHLRDPHKLLPHIIHTLSDRPVSSTTELSTAKFALALADNIAYLY